MQIKRFFFDSKSKMMVDDFNEIFEKEEIKYITDLVKSENPDVNKVYDFN